ncbi:MAG: VWA domain-containing protein [Nitrospinota bacterium]|nr:MAG: VWA domain-containing protein [Nitrospinota bacterium]
MVEGDYSFGKAREDTRIMIRLADPWLLLAGLLLLWPYLLAPRSAWYYSNVALLKKERQIDPPALLVAGLTWTAVLFLLIALARPQGTLEKQEQVVEVRDILLVLDLSLSMEGKIPAGPEQGRVRKLDLVRQASLQFVQRHPQDRLGLLVFGDDAFGVWPLSTDSTMLRQRLQRLDGLLPSKLRGTYLVHALLKALHHFQELGQARTKLLLLLTDGLDSMTPDEERQIIRRLRQEGVMLYLLGMELEEDSSIVQLTRRAQGRYFNINRGEELEAALREIDRLERSPVKVVQSTERKELYPFFALTALALLMVAFLLKQTWVITV